MRTRHDTGNGGLMNRPRYDYLKTDDVKGFFEDRDFETDATALATKP